VVRSCLRCAHPAAKFGSELSQEQSQPFPQHLKKIQRFLGALDKVQVCLGWGVGRDRSEFIPSESPEMFRISHRHQVSASRLQGFSGLDASLVGRGRGTAELMNYKSLAGL
jgi:hypothetical protein